MNDDELAHLGQQLARIAKDLALSVEEPARLMRESMREAVKALEGLEHKILSKQ